MELQNNTRALCRMILCCQVILSLLPGLLFAHPALLKQIKVVSSKISNDRSNSQLYLKRAELYLEHRDWKHSLADLDTVEAMLPDEPVLDYLRAQIAFAREDYPTAKVSINRFLSRKQNHQKGILLRARVLTALKESSAAIENYSRCINLANSPDPEWYVERARVRADGPPTDYPLAIAELKEGVDRLGVLIALKIEVVQLKLLSADTTGALLEIDQLIETAPRPEQWLYQKGQILQNIGKVEAACKAYREALQHVKKLPARHRHTLAMSRLKGQCRAALARLETVNQ